MTLEQEIERGHRAKRIYEDDLFVDAHTKLRASILRAFEHSREDDQAGRERAFLELKLLNALVGDLKRVMETGELAGRQIERHMK